MSEKKDSKTIAMDSGQKAMMEVAKFKDTLKDKSKEELEKLEQDLIKTQDEHNDARNKKEFKMPAKNWKEAATAIRMALDTMTVQWQYALVLKTLYEFFDPEKHPETITYPLLDSLLCQISNAQLKGYDQWKAVVTISDYFEPIRQAYADTAAEIYVDAEKHNMVVNALQMFQAKDEVQEGLEKKP